MSRRFERHLEEWQGWRDRVMSADPAELRAELDREPQWTPAKGWRTITHVLPDGTEWVEILEPASGPKPAGDSTDPDGTTWRDRKGFL